MPKVIKAALVAAAVVFVTIAIISSGGTLAPLFTGSGFLAGLSVAAQYAVVTFVGSIVAGGVGMLTSRGISATSQNFGTKIAGRGAQVPRQIVYGECRVGGTIVKMHTSGTKNNKLHLAIVLAGHEIESLQGVYFNDTLLTTTSSTISGETVFRVSNSKYKNSDNENAITSGGVLVQYTFHDGSQTSVDGLANANSSSRYPSTAKFSGLAYVYMEIIYDPEKMASLPPIHFRIRGKKVYDPRTSSTAWSANPALIIRDFLTDTTYGLRALSSEINDTTSGGGFAAAANSCDVDVTLADNSSTEDRFTLNGFINAAASGDGVLEGFLSSCAGKITYTNGKFNLFVGTAQTPSLTIDDDDVLDTQQLTTKSGNGDLFNGIKAVFVDKDQNYQGTESPVLVDSTYLSEDTPSGEQSANYKKLLETQLPFTVTHTMAQRLQKIQLKRHRESATLSVLTTLEFMKLQPGDWVSVNNSRLNYSAKSFEVLSTQMEFAENEGVIYAATRLTLQEVSAGIYNYIYSEYSTPQTAGSTPPGGDLSVATPTAGTLTQRTRREGPTAKIDIIASWTNAVQAAVQGTEIQYKESGESTYDTATIAGRGQTTAVINNVQVGKIYDVRIRHFSWDNVYGAFVDYSQITIAEPDTIAAPGNPSATTDKPFFIELTWTNPTNVNFRAVEVHISTSTGFTPDATTLQNSYYGEPGKQKKVILGVSAGLAYDTNYYFKLRSVNIYGTTSGYTNQATGKFKKAQDADVENLTAGAITSGTIDAGTITVENIDAGNINTGILDSAYVNTGEIVVGGLESGVTIDSGSLTMSAGGHIKGGQTEYNDADASGFFLGYDTNAYKFSIGNADNSQRLTFDGSNLSVKGTLTVGSTDLTEDNTLNSNVSASDLGLNVTAALEHINHNAVANISFTVNSLDGSANPGEITISAGVMKAGSTTRTTNLQGIVTPYEGSAKPPYSGNHFFIIWGASQAWSSDTSARFQSSDSATLSYSGGTPIFVAIYDEANDQWKAVDNAGSTTDFTPLASDYAIAVGTKTSGSGGIDTLDSLIAFADDPEADQTATALSAGTTITGGGITMSSGGSIKGGQTAFNSGTGFFLGYDTDAYKLSIGDASSNSLTFNGSDLSVTGSITAGSFTLSSGATVTDSGNQVINTQNNAFFRLETTAANDDVSAPSDSAFITAFGRSPRNNDIVIVINTASDPEVSAAYVYATNAWVAKNDFLTGDILIDGTVVADKLNVNQLSAISGDLGTLTAGTIDATDVDIENLTVNNIAGDVSTIDTFTATNISYANQTAVAKDMVAIAAQTHAYRPFVTINATALMQDNMTVWGELQMRVNLTGSKTSIGTVASSIAGFISEFFVLNAYVVLPTSSTVQVGDLIGLTSDSNASYKVVGISSFSTSLFVYVTTTAGALVTTAPPTGAYSSFGQTSSYVTVSKSYAVERSGTSWKPMFFQGALSDTTTNSVDVRVVFYRSSTLTGSSPPTTSSSSKAFGILNIQGTVMLAR